jgi:hypothetical protein
MSLGKMCWTVRWFGCTHKAGTPKDSTVGAGHHGKALGPGQPGVLGSVQPAQIGTSFSRSYNFWNNHIILTTNAAGRVTRAVWQYDLN